jgi:CTP:molybdopterin cytidylyltransferase MocA
VDRPGFNLSTLQALVREKRSVRPICNGKGGHPVNIQPRDIDKILAASPSDSLREIIRFQDVQVEGADFTLNIDTAEDIEKLQQWYGSQNK